MNTLQVLKNRKAEAEEALHELEIGQQVSVFVDQNGERVEYRASQSSKLRTYIAELDRRIKVAGRRTSQFSRPMKAYV